MRHDAKSSALRCQRCSLFRQASARGSSVSGPVFPILSTPYNMCRSPARLVAPRLLQNSSAYERCGNGEPRHLLRTRAGCQSAESMCVHLANSPVRQVRASRWLCRPEVRAIGPLPGGRLGESHLTAAVRRVSGGTELRDLTASAQASRGSHPALTDNLRVPASGSAIQTRCRGRCMRASEADARNPMDWFPPSNADSPGGSAAA